MKPIIFKIILIAMACSPRAYALDYSLGTHIKYTDYEEFDLDGSSLNHETGFVPGIDLSVSHTHHRIWGSYSYGNVAYDGQLQSGVPHKTDTNYILLSGGYEFNYRVDKSTLLLGVSQHQWQRHILPNNGIVGVNSIYTWQQLHVGVRQLTNLIYDIPIEIEFGLIRTRQANVDINLESFGFGSPQLEPGDKTGFQAAFRYNKSLAEKLVLHVQLSTARWEFARSQSKTISNGVSTVSIAEPRSLSWHTSLNAAIAFSF